MGKFIRCAIASLTTFVLISCGGGGGGSAAGTNSATSPPVSSTEVSGINSDIKTFKFSWADVSDASFYRLFENPDLISGFSQVSGDIASGVGTFSHTVPLHKRPNAQYSIASCNSAGCTDGTFMIASDIDNFTNAIGYFKASNTGTNDSFGYSVSLSGDGKTMAVGAIHEDSAATGINDNQSDNSISDSGAVYVFSMTDTGWAQQAYIKPSNTTTNHRFGTSVSLSGDGNTLAVGTLISPKAYVFSRTGSTWSEQAIIESNIAPFQGGFGNQVSISSDGNTLAVGSPLDSGTGAAYIFVRSGSNWSQQAYIKASNADAQDSFGTALHLSSDGNTLAVGAFQEDSSASGINGIEGNNLPQGGSSGAAYVFTRDSNSWSQQAYIKASNPGLVATFGRSISLSANGDTLVVGSDREGSTALGIDGGQTTSGSNFSGATYVYTRSGSAWSQQAYIKADRAVQGFGTSIDLSDDANTLIVGTEAVLSGLNYSGVSGSGGFNGSAVRAGIAFVFTRNNSSWIQESFVNASNAEEGDYFGGSVALSADGNTLAVGARLEDSAATGVGGDQSDNSLSVGAGSTSEGSAGAVYLF
ncbi:MAG: hypothetical protein ACI9KN_001278 [Gammaproteobacteria bacterium]|jgi:hypothetical protein